MGRMFSMISTKREISPARSSWLKYDCYCKHFLVVSITLCCALSPQMIAYLTYLGQRIPFNRANESPSVMVCSPFWFTWVHRDTTLKCSLNRPNHGYHLHKQPQPPDYTTSTNRPQINPRLMLHSQCHKPSQIIFIFLRLRLKPFLNGRFMAARVDLH